MTPEAQGLIVVGEVLGVILTGGVTGGGEEGFLKASVSAIKELASGFVSAKGLTTATFFVGVGAGLQFLVGMYGGTSFSGAETGEDRYTTGAIATNYQNAAVGRGVAYGRKLDPAEARASRIIATQDMVQAYQQKPLGYRYFAIDNPYSLVGNLAAIVPSSFGSLAYRLQSGLSHIGSIFSSRVIEFVNPVTLFSGLLNHHAYAASSSDLMADYNYFGIDQWGWSADELYKLTNDESYDTIQNGGWVIAHNQNSELDQQYQKCYSPAAQTDDALKDSACSSESLKQESALRWRLYQLQNEVIDQLKATGQST
ncbi:hypothetical protein HY218_01520 [Candidatus Saccharibacteria bacterium]|nr:hypothetical protein [Candidatus Saccharibacteria bacterium]